MTVGEAVFYFYHGTLETYAKLNLHHFYPLSQGNGLPTLRETVNYGDKGF